MRRNGAKETVFVIVSRVGIWRRSQPLRPLPAPSSAIVPEQSLLFALPVPLLLRFPALSCTFFAPRQRQLDLGSPAAVEIDGQRNRASGHMAGYRAVQLGDFAVLQQQLPLPSRLMVEAVAVA